MKNAIYIYNRQSKSIETEQVYKQRFMDWLYTSFLGLMAEKLFFSRIVFSKLYGSHQNSPKSAGKRIQSFIEQYNIDTSECEKSIEDYQSFNDFFSRKLAPTARLIDQEPKHLISPVDGRLLYYDLQEHSIIPVKGRAFNLSSFLGDANLAHEFCRGACFVFRLAPVDYHRIHFIDDGKQTAIRRIGRRLHSVSPLSLKAGIPVFLQNVRDICTLSTKNFAQVLHIDVGALAVGRIDQNLPKGGDFQRGQEKGIFRFGGSTVVLIFKEGLIQVDEDIQQQSIKGTETLVKLGERIGRKVIGSN